MERTVFKTMMTAAVVTVGLIAMAPKAASAGEVTVVDVKVERTAPGVFTFAVTLEHADTGWEHYADRWDVVGPDGTVLGSRTLHHPHVDEQPFTRTLDGVRIPDTIREVTVRGHDTVHKLAGPVKLVSLPTP